MTSFPDRLSMDMNRDPLVAVVRQVIASAGPTWLPRQRWFGDKSRGIRETFASDVALASAAHEQYAFAVVNVLFTDDGQASYLLTLAMIPDEDATPPSEVIARFELNGTRYVVSEATASSRFRSWLLDQLAEERVLHGQQSAIAFARTSALPSYLAAARSSQSRVLRSEQSNSSIVYGDALIFKLFRKVEPGINPDIEIGRFLTERTSFTHAPLLLGHAIQTSSFVSECSIAMAQSFVPNTGDAWTYTLEFLRQLLVSDDSSAAPGHADQRNAYLVFAERLGERTAQLHVALASQDDDSAFAPEPVTPEIIAAWERATLDAASTTQVIMDRALPQLPPEQQRLIAPIELNSASLEPRIQGYQQLAGTSCIRVHGDYHLGQVLRTADNDAVILDFEGEPSRPINERRRKTSALKDVAGMLRSFRYARGATLKSLGSALPVSTVDERLADWEQQARTAFLHGYRNEIGRARVPLVPADNASFEQALAAWELDKALYEIQYEANNRPNWLDIPLSTIAS